MAATDDENGLSNTPHSEISLQGNWQILYLFTAPKKVRHAQSKNKHSKKWYRKAEFGAPGSHYSVNSHFFLIYNVNGQKKVFSHAIELLLYQDHKRCTMYINKLDSSGFGKKLPVSLVIVHILHFLISGSGKQSISLSLFAKSKVEYLFPGSNKNKSKKILDDSALIHWWVSILDNIISKEDNGNGFIFVAGLDKKMTERFISNCKNQWYYGVPYSDRLPVELAIPRFPDDPKHRFLLDLCSDNSIGSYSASQFWKNLAYRQECSSGHLVGYVSAKICKRTLSNSKVIGMKATNIKLYEAFKRSLLSCTFSNFNEAAASSERMIDLWDKIYDHKEGVKLDLSDFIQRPEMME